MKPYIELNNANIVIFTTQITHIDLNNDAKAQIHLTSGKVIDTKHTVMEILALINKP